MGDQLAPAGARTPPPNRPTAIGTMEPNDRFEAVLQAIDKLTVRQLRQLTVEVNLRLEFRTRKP